MWGPTGLQLGKNQNKDWEANPEAWAAQTGRGAAAHIGVLEPAQIHVLNWDWWPQTRPAPVACLASRVPFRLSVPRVKHE